MRRITAAVFGLAGHETLAEAAAQVTVPVESLLQWDDELVPHDSGLALFAAFASREKTLQPTSATRKSPRSSWKAQGEAWYAHQVKSQAQKSFHWLGQVCHAVPGSGFLALCPIDGPRIQSLDRTIVSGRLS